MIGEEVRRRREGLGLTGAQLAERAGMAPSAVSQIETGKRTPSSSSVVKLAAGLGVEVGALFPKSQRPLPLEDRPLPRGPEVVGEAYFVEPEEDEEPDVVTLRVHYVRLLEENDRLLQEVSRLREQLAKAESSVA